MKKYTKEELEFADIASKQVFNSKLEDSLSEAIKAQVMKGKTNIEKETEKIIDALIRIGKALNA